MLHKNLDKEQLKRFMRKQRVNEVWLVDGMTFKQKKNAEAHCGRNKIDAATIVCVTKEEQSEKQKGKSKKEEAPKEVQNENKIHTPAMESEKK